MDRRIFWVRALLTCVLLGCCEKLQHVSAVTRSSDVSAMAAISEAWPSTSKKLNWVGDPCETRWTGVTCDASNTTVTKLLLLFQDIKGIIPPAIGDLQGLTDLDLSSNGGLTGSIPPELGKLENLELLNLQYCGLSGPLPSELGNLSKLNFLGLNTNNFSGSIPPELGKTNLTWLDISENGFEGQIPVASNSPNSVGLDNLTYIEHYHLNNNSLTGYVPVELYSMTHVLHVLVDHNKLSGDLSRLQNISNSVKVVRLDFNRLQGPIPKVFENATNISELNFKNNLFSGPIPDLSGISSLSMLDLSENQFDPQIFPSWITQLQQITTLNLAQINLFGPVDPGVFSLTKLQSIDLRFNQLNGTLTFPAVPSSNLIELDLESNAITGFSGQPPRGLSLGLENNPICSNSFIQIPSACGGYLGQTFQNPVASNCSGQPCGGGKLLNPKTCICSYPLELTLLLTAPTFSNLDETAPVLEADLAKPLNVSVDQVYISNMIYQNTSRVEVIFRVFPSTGDSFPKDFGNTIILKLRQHQFPLPEGPYLLPDAEYAGASSHSHMTTAQIIGIVVGCAAGVMIIGSSISFAIYHKMRADRAVMSNPFASWGGGSAEFGEAPKLKGARWFSLAELKEYTNNWSSDNQIGEGGYGKVYRGLLPNKDPVAIKRATAGSMQGATEFKNEIELLSRVHHRNLVGLVGFCYEGGEQALIYEYMSNGTVNDHLKGRGDAPLSWDQRLQIALESARGLSYLHDHASPPILHRDIKSANILLNDKLVAKVADFGLSKLAPDEGEKLVHSVHVKGTLGYLDPEYYMTQDLTDKSDVYSFGVVLLELLTARPPIDAGRYVVREMRTALDKGGLAAVRPILDPALRDIPLKELDAYLKIALSCVEEEGAHRPTMTEVMKLLERLDVKAGGHTEETNGGKKVKFADDVITEADDKELLAKESNKAGSDSFKYSGSFGISTTVRPK